MWLIHSTPHFPQIAPKYQFPMSGLLKGQSFLCISLDFDNLNKVGIQLQYNQPQIFDSRLQAVMKLRLHQITKVVNGIIVAKAPWFHLAEIRSKKGYNFTSFAKADNFRKELYEDWVAPTLQTSLFVETWLNGKGKLPSNCSRPFRYISPISSFCVYNDYLGKSKTIRVIRISKLILFIKLFNTINLNCICQESLMNANKHETCRQICAFEYTFFLTLFLF